MKENVYDKRRQYFTLNKAAQLKYTERLTVRFQLGTADIYFYTYTYTYYYTVKVQNLDCPGSGQLPYDISDTCPITGRPNGGL